MLNPSAYQVSITSFSNAALMELPIVVSDYDVVWHMIKLRFFLF